MMEVYNNLDQKLTVPPNLLPEGRTDFYPHHFQSTAQDNLIELSGRICYDSTKQEKTRGSKDYHKHINEVKHGSTQEHINLCIQFDMFEYLDMLKVYAALANIPGIQVDYKPEGTGRSLVVTANLRVINEWAHYLPLNPDWRPHFLLIGTVFSDLAAKVCPLAHSRSIPAWENAVDCLFTTVLPSTDDQIFISFHIDEVSRNLTHELVRHKWRTAVSQRSTRYVDESESDIAWHPLLKKELVGPILEKNKTALQTLRALYDSSCVFMQDLLIKEGTDKLTAQKQARGAARGILPTALSTECIFTASLAQWKRMLLLRVSDHADAEIRLLFTKIFDILEHHPNPTIRASFRTWADDFAPLRAKDGIGKHLCRI